MPFKRTIDSNYPLVYDTWKSGDVTWVIQDLLPQDDEEALKILVGHLCTDEVLCTAQKLCEDPLSVEEMADFWRDCLSRRMSLACYREEKGVRNLAGLNVCIVGDKGEHYENTFKAKKWYNVFEVLKIAEEKVDPYEYLNMDRLLHAMGLVVQRQYRGNRIGERLLNARTALSLPLGIKGTVTVFTGITSQRPAANCGFETIASVTFKELIEMGLPYPDEDKTVKCMVKKFV